MDRESTEAFGARCRRHEGVLGWFGGAEKITGKAAPPQVIEDRLSLMREALQSLFGDAFEFGASWTYVSCEPRP